MVKSSTLSRRSFLAAQGGIIAVGATPIANASAPKNWANATEKEFAPLCGEAFFVKFPDGSKHSLTLKDTESSRADWRRPLHLRRSRGMTLSFDAPAKALEAFALQPDAILKISHKSLGKTDVFMTAVPLKSGKIRLEAIFN